MSEFTEDVLDELHCQCCGDWMDDVLATPESQAFEVPGNPRTCRSCAGEALHQQVRQEKPRRKRESGK